MDPDLFAAFSNGNPLSCSTQPLIQPATAQAADLQARLTTPEPEVGVPPTLMQQADSAKRNRCIAALAAFAAAAGDLDGYISSSLETVLDDLSMRKAAVILDQQSGVTTGSVSAIVEGSLTDNITSHTTEMDALDQAIIDYEAEVISQSTFEATLDTVSGQLESLTPAIGSGISAETTEKARIEKQHKAMSNTMRAQNLMNDPATQVILFKIGIG